MSVWALLRRSRDYALVEAEDVRAALARQDEPRAKPQGANPDRKRMEELGNRVAKHHNLPLTVLPLEEVKK